MTVDPFPNVPQFNDTFRAAVTECNGFVYEGTDLQAQIRLMKWLRTNPDETRKLMRGTRPMLRASCPECGRIISTTSSSDGPAGRIWGLRWHRTSPGSNKSCDVRIVSDSDLIFRFEEKALP